MWRTLKSPSVSTIKAEILQHRSNVRRQGWGEGLGRACSSEAGCRLTCTCCRSLKLCLSQLPCPSISVLFSWWACDGAQWGLCPPAWPRRVTSHLLPLSTVVWTTKLNVSRNNILQNKRYFFLLSPSKTAPLPKGFWFLFNLTCICHLQNWVLFEVLYLY